MMGGKPEAVDAAFAFLVAAVIAWLLVPVAERLARRIGRPTTRTSAACTRSRRRS